MAFTRNLSIIIPSYNGCSLLQRTLRTVEVAAPGAEVLVVDGRSHDGSPEMVEREFPWVRLYSYANHGFAHACNRGLEHATRDFLLLLNSDLFVTRAAIESMVSRLASEDRVAAVSPVLLNEDGSRQHLFGWPFGVLWWPNFIQITEPLEVPVITAACLMTRRDVLREVGGFDENFFLYNEEHDWCSRAKNAGYRIELLPEMVVHVGGGSTAENPNLWLEAQRGYLYFTQKQGRPRFLEVLRRAMQLQGLCYKYMDPRPQHREMWERLRSLTERADYLDTPFPLSGRGDSPAQPKWQAMADRPETREAVRAPAASVVRLAAERARLFARRPSRVAAAR